MARRATPRSEKKGRSIVLESWWLEEANRRIKGIPMREVAVRISSGREKPWDETSVRDFLRGAHATQEKALAFSREFKIPAPVYYPRSYAEADRMRAVAADYDPAPSRALKVDDIVDVVEAEAVRQTDDISSHDEAGSKRRGAGRMGRGRTPTS
jgi:hypothetical protein